MPCSKKFIPFEILEFFNVLIFLFYYFRLPDFEAKAKALLQSQFAHTVANHKLEHATAAQHLADRAASSATAAALELNNDNILCHHRGVELTLLERYYRMSILFKLILVCPYFGET